MAKADGRGRRSVTRPDPLPHDAAAERAILGSILLDNKVLERIAGAVEAADFFIEGHQILFGAMQALAAAGEPIDAVTLGNRLVADGTLRQAGGALVFGELTEGIATTAHADHYARLVRGKAAVRRMVLAAQRVVQEGLRGDFADATEWVEQAQATVRDTADWALSGQRAPRTLMSYAEEVRWAYELSRAGTAGLPLPWPTISSMVGGLRYGTVTAFVARPSAGKSRISVLIAKHVWGLPERHERVLLVSPEMSATDMAERFYVAAAGVTYMDVVHGKLGGFEEPKFYGTMDRLRGASGLWVLDGAADDLTEHSLEAAIRATNPTLVCIDSFYDLNFPGRDDNERVRNIARWVYRSCKRHKYACVVGSQQNREQEKSKAKGGGSRLGTIAFSDAIGQRFDAVFALERDEKVKQAKQVRVRPLKIRRGHDRGPVLLWWEDLSEVEEGAAGGGEDGGEIPY